MKRFAIVSCLVFLIVPALAVLCMIGVTLLAGLSSSAGGTLGTGRSVTATSDSISLYVEYGGDTATIRTAGRTIIVKPTALLIDGANVADIDEKTLKVEVFVKRGSIKFIADGNPVTTTIP